MTLWRDDPVPQAWRGLWRRLTLEEPDGSVDLETTVLWMQAGRYYCDIRVPPDCPDFTNTSCFADLNEKQIRFLASQEAFAGTLRWHGSDDGTGEGHWARAIDFSPPAGPDDEGRLIPDRRMMVEYGLHRDYIEYWWQEAPRPDPNIGGLLPNGSILVRAGDKAMFAIDRRSATPAPGVVLDLALASLGQEEAVAALLDCEVAFGTVDGNSCHISLSTLPWREGATIDLNALHFIAE